jgi:hypothetical protein
MNLEEERKKIYAETRTDLLKRQLFNAENYDKAILSLATAALGFSLAFLKDVAPVTNAQAVWLLKASWFLLTASLMSTLCSFFASRAGIRKQLHHANKYYLEHQEEFLSKSNWPAKITDYLNMASGVCFILAIIAQYDRSHSYVQEYQSESNDTGKRRPNPPNAAGSYRYGGARCPDPKDATSNAAYKSCKP